MDFENIGWSRERILAQMDANEALPRPSRETMRFYLGNKMRKEADERLGFVDLGLVPGKEYSWEELRAKGISPSVYVQAYNDVQREKLEINSEVRRVFADYFWSETA